MIKEKHGFNTDNCQFIYGAAILNETKPVKELKIAPSNYIVIYSPTRQKSIAQPEKIDSMPQGIIDPRPAPQLPPKELPDSPVVEISSPKPTHAQNVQQNQDPPNFDQLVLSLQEMGFTEDQCKQALRARNYEVDAAADYLINGGAGAAPPPPPQPSPPRVPSDRGGKYGELQSAFDSLSDDEKAAVTRLESLGLDPITVLQVYMACGKDETATATCITEMMNG